MRAFIVLGLVGIPAIARAQDATAGVDPTVRLWIITLAVIALTIVAMLLNSLLSKPKIESPPTDTDAMEAVASFEKSEEIARKADAQAKATDRP